MDDNYKTVSWKIVQEFNSLASRINCKVVNKTKYPLGAADLEINIWNATIPKKQKLLEENDKETKVTKDNGRLALWVIDDNGIESPSMIPNPAYRFVSYDPISCNLQLEKTSFSEIEALKHKSYRDLFETRNLPIPHGPLCASLYAATLDGYFIATKRGIGTPNYPGSLFCIGGNIDDPSLNISEFLLKKEFTEEVRFYSSLSKRMLAKGIIWDECLQKHDLVVVAQYDLPFDYANPPLQYVADVKGLEQISIRRDELGDCLIENYHSSTDPQDKGWFNILCASSHAGLFLIGKQLHGKDWAEEVYKEMTLEYQK